MLPYMRAWNEKYKDHGLVVIGVHSPELAFEKKLSNVEQAVQDLVITYPVAVDSGLDIWKAFDNEYWPAHYFVDQQGNIRYDHFGQGEYDKSERVIQTLLAEAGYHDVPSGVVNPQATGVQDAADSRDLKSPETYIGYKQAENFISGPLAYNVSRVYDISAGLELNQLGVGWDMDGWR
jgi:hypothetical protein